MVTYEVLLWLKGSSQPIVYDALSLYIKSAYTCVVFIRDDGERRVHKYPTIDVFRVEEEYKYVGRHSIQA